MKNLMVIFDMRLYRIFFFLHEDADIEDTIVMVNFVRNMARIEAGEGTVIYIDG